MATIYSYTFNIEAGKVKLALLEENENCKESKDKSYWHKERSAMAIYTETMGKVVYRNRTYGAFTLDSFKPLSIEDIQYQVESQTTIFDYEMQRLKQEYNNKRKEVQKAKERFIHEMANNQ